MKKQKYIFGNLQKIIFDMDGVITSESGYWTAAELTVLEVLYSDQFIGIKDGGFEEVLKVPGKQQRSGFFISDSFISALKNCGINSNWDLSYYSFSLYLIELLRTVGTACKLETLDFSDSYAPGSVLKKLGQSLPDRGIKPVNIDELSAGFLAMREKRIESRGERKNEMLAGDFASDINAWGKERAGNLAPVFRISDGLWKFCRELFQGWYLGDRQYRENGGEYPSAVFKEGIINNERPVIPESDIAGALSDLKESGLQLGVATGRPLNEITIPLTISGLIDYFEKDSFCTYSDINKAESFFAAKGKIISYAKPHPYIYLCAIYPGRGMKTLLKMKLPLPVEEGRKIMIVGDSASDMMAAKSIGCLSCAVLTGATDRTAVEKLKSFKPDLVIENIAMLPACL